MNHWFPKRKLSYNLYWSLQFVYYVKTFSILLYNIPFALRWGAVSALIMCVSSRVNLRNESHYHRKGAWTCSWFAWELGCAHGMYIYTWNLQHIIILEMHWKIISASQLPPCASLWQLKQPNWLWIVFSFKIIFLPVIKTVLPWELLYYNPSME